MQSNYKGRSFIVTTYLPHSIYDTIKTKDP